MHFFAQLSSARLCIDRKSGPAQGNVLNATKTTSKFRTLETSEHAAPHTFQSTREMLLWCGQHAFCKLARSAFDNWAPCMAMRTRKQTNHKPCHASVKAAAGHWERINFRPKMAYVIPFGMQKCQQAFFNGNALRWKQQHAILQERFCTSTPKPAALRLLSSFPCTNKHWSTHVKHGSTSRIQEQIAAAN